MPAPQPAGDAEPPPQRIPRAREEREDLSSLAEPLLELAEESWEEEAETAPLPDWSGWEIRWDPSEAALSGGARPLRDEEVLCMLDEFLYQGELPEFALALAQFDRVADNLQAQELDKIILPCLEVMEFANPYLRMDALLCLLHISMGCLLPEAPVEQLGPAMRSNAALLAQYGIILPLVRSLENCLPVHHSEAQDNEDAGMAAREMRIILNLIYLQVLFHENQPDFIQMLGRGSKFQALGRPVHPEGSGQTSLIMVLFQALVPGVRGDNGDKVLPIRKVVLLLLRVLQRLLQVPDKVLYPATNASFQGPRVFDFQAFTALHEHQRQTRQKYAGSGCPDAVVESLRLAQKWEDEFLTTYTFHPAELEHLRTSEPLRDACRRYEELQQLARGRQSQTPSEGTLPALTLPFHQHAGEISGSPCTHAESPSSARSSSVATEVPLGTPECPAAAEAIPSPPSARDASWAASCSSHDSGPLEWRRLFNALRPALRDLMILLLRLVLNSSVCSDVINACDVLDLWRERRAADMHEGLAFSGELEFPDPVEDLRHRQLLACAAGGILLVLIKSARRYNPEDYATVMQYLSDHHGGLNGAIVVLKVLNTDPPPENAPPTPVLSCLRPAVGSAHCPLSSKYREECGNARLLELLHMLCKTCPDRVRKYLVQYRASFILKRLHKSVGSPVHRLILKLMKKQVRHLPRKWKQTNMKILSACYLQVAMSPLEDWLLSEPRGEAGPEASAMAQDLKPSNAALIGQGTTRPPPHHANFAKASRVLRRHMGHMHAEMHAEDCLGYAHAFPEFAAPD